MTRIGVSLGQAAQTKNELRNRLTPPEDGIVRVAFVLGDGATVIDFAGPWEVFQDTMVRNTMVFSLYTVADDLQPIVASGGLLVTPNYAFHDPKMPEPNVIVIGAQSKPTKKKLDWIRAASRHADVTMSVCTGAFLLAETGLLDGLSATTHHDFYDQFAAEYSNVTLVRGPRYVENRGGRICSAGGLTSGIELALRIVDRYFGSEQAAKTAYYLEYDPSSRRPSAGQETNATW